MTMIVTMMRMMEVATTTLIITIEESEECTSISVFILSLFMVVVVNSEELVIGSAVGSVVGGCGVDGGLGGCGSGCVVVGGRVMMVSGGQIEPMA